MVSCDVELIVASCHRSWGHRESDVAFSVEQIVVPAVMDVLVIMQRRCVATLDVPQIQFIARVYRHSSSQCNGSAGFGGDVGAFRGSSAFFVLLLLELNACQLAPDFVDIHIASPWPAHNTQHTTHNTQHTTHNNNNTIWRGSVLTSEEPPHHSGELNHALHQAGGPTQSLLSRPLSSGHHISMEHRLRRKHLNSDTNASSKSYLKEIQEKRKETLFS